ncbi:MAG: sulfurtransferase TusA family protein [Gemmatales bacterium]|nr:sulfurtransferase TusA family protein [Gemmatales bacterium]MCS7159364.1 sulfurtransferase TusA family protein [Gemmatales bacterium]MDW8174564.1 sulfurtransferase TusA family protein [Gemmatales bacterium]MDW8222785.1 sulfurtransferase TusA family protein [Gemmatales bacterium]
MITKLACEPASYFCDESGQVHRVDAHLDVRGLICPAPALESLKATAALRPGQVLEITGDWLESKFEVPAAVLRPGYSILAILEDDGSDLWKIYVRRDH